MWQPKAGFVTDKYSSSQLPHKLAGRSFVMLISQSVTRGNNLAIKRTIQNCSVHT